MSRVRELLKREIGEAIRREVPVDDAGLVTVNEVEVAPDLRTANVFISVFGGGNQQKKGLSMLLKKRGRIQAIVAKKVILKYTPHLRFVVDDSVEKGNRVLEILKELEQSDPAK